MEPQPEKQITLNNQAELAYFLDKNCSVLMNARELRDRLKATNPSADLASTINLEDTVLGFWFQGCTIRREWSATTTEGLEIGSPIPNQMKPEALDYLVKRFEQTSNPYLKARYGLTLWNAKGHKHIKYIHGAFNSLIEALKKAECSDEGGLRNCNNILRQMCAIAAGIKYKQEDAVSAVLERFSNNVPFDRKGRNQLFTIITQHPKLFRSEASAIIETARILFEENFEAEDFFACQHISKLAARFAQGINLDVQEWHYRTGRACEGLARARLDDSSGLIPYKFYTDAAKAYQLSGDKDAERQALLKIQNLKGSLRFGKVSYQMPDDEAKILIEGIKQETEHILSMDIDEIIYYLSSSERILPNYENIHQQVAKMDSSFFDIIPSSYMDINKNVQQPTNDAYKEDSTGKVRHLYSIHLSIQQHILVNVFIEGYRNGKITFPALSAYLDRHSWIAQPLTENDLDGNTIEYTWQGILYPAIQEFFKQLDLVLQESPETPSSFVLCLDSLTLKVEGMLRELLQRAGGPTVAAHRKGDLKEVYFDDLVYMATESRIITENEAYFFSYVFTGLSRNIRNDIAHAYYHLPEHYSLQKSVLVLCAVIRLTRFNFIPRSTTTESD